MLVEEAGQTVLPRTGPHSTPSRDCFGFPCGSCTLSPVFHSEGAETPGHSSGCCWLTVTGPAGRSPGPSPPGTLPGLHPTWPWGPVENDKLYRRKNQMIWGCLSPSGDSRRAQTPGTRGTWRGERPGTPESARCVNVWKQRLSQGTFSNCKGNEASSL